MKLPVIHWFRRDLRLDDNTALIHAAQSGSPIIPLFILDNHLLNSQYSGEMRNNYLFHALHELDQRLQRFGTRLLVRRGNPIQVLGELISQYGVTDLYFNRDYSPYATRRDAELSRQLAIQTHTYDDAVLLAPGTVTKADGSPYIVYTPFWKNWQQHSKSPVLSHPFEASNFYSVENSNQLPEHKPIPLAFSEASAHQLLQQFITSDIHHYAEKRNWLPINPFQAPRPQGTSYLSPYLRLGVLSPRQAYWAARNAYGQTRSIEYKKSIETWVSELAWREFFVHIMAHFPHVMQRDFVNTYQSLAWRNAPDELAAWQRGETGYPIIDAPMRQLNTIGWMPNRARMIVASFLTKDLLIHWKEGERYFMQHLIDGDPAANNGGWQWAAGTGTDAQPYFRIFNPVSQSEKFATPEYLRFWIPELQSVPDTDIHEPWNANRKIPNYPLPIVDHAFARERTLQAFKAARGE